MASEDVIIDAVARGAVEAYVWVDCDEAFKKSLSGSLSLDFSGEEARYVAMLVDSGFGDIDMSINRLLANVALELLDLKLLDDRQGSSPPHPSVLLFYLMRAISRCDRETTKRLGIKRLGWTSPESFRYAKAVLEASVVAFRPKYTAAIENALQIWEGVGVWEFWREHLTDKRNGAWEQFSSNG